MINKDIVCTQIRLPAYLHEYIKAEAERMGIAQNAFLTILLEKGKQVWEASVTVTPVVPK